MLILVSKRTDLIPKDKVLVLNLILTLISFCLFCFRDRSLSLEIKNKAGLMTKKHHSEGRSLKSSEVLLMQLHNH